MITRKLLVAALGVALAAGVAGQASATSAAPASPLHSTAVQKTQTATGHALVAPKLAKGKISRSKQVVTAKHHRKMGVRTAHAIGKKAHVAHLARHVGKHRTVVAGGVAKQSAVLRNVRHSLHKHA